MSVCVHASQVALVVKKPDWQGWRHEMQVRSLGWEEPLEEGTATHSSILAWRIPWTETQLSMHAHTHTHTHTHTHIYIHTYTYTLEWFLISFWVWMPMKVWSKLRILFLSLLFPKNNKTSLLLCMHKSFPYYLQMVTETSEAIHEPLSVIQRLWFRKSS